MLHPGEKRLLAHVAHLDIVPEGLDQHVRALLRATAVQDDEGILATIDALSDTTDQAIRRHGLSGLVTHLIQS